MAWGYLFLAVCCEVLGTSALKGTQEFTRFWPTLLVLGSYALSFYFLTLTLRYIPVSIAYAIWSAVGIVLIALIAYFFYDQQLDAPAIIGIIFIIAGVVIIHLFSEISTS